VKVTDSTHSDAHSWSQLSQSPQARQLFTLRQVSQDSQPVRMMSVIGAVVPPTVTSVS
jgi:hypothetical protein